LLAPATWPVPPDAFGVADDVAFAFGVADELGLGLADALGVGVADEE